MLINLKLIEEGAPFLIGAPPPTITLWAKVDGVLSIFPSKDHEDRSEITVVGIPKVLTAMESADSLAGRINGIYQQMGAKGSFINLGTKSGN